jgi:DNA polymerase I-like protein with 3'-5' exonuclease and polymerase domains/uracil-DNA glycosylase
MRKVLGYGPEKADVVIIEEAPDEEEEIEGKPFVGASGRELTRMLREAGIRRDECYVTNVCKYRPPGNRIEAWVTDKKKTGTANEWPYKDGRWYSEEIAEGLNELSQEIAERDPKIVIGLGNVPLWAITGQWGVTDWRGSEMYTAENVPFVPTLHPASILRSWSTRPFVVTDFKQRVARRLRDGFKKPDWHFNIAPTLQEVLFKLNTLTGDVSIDIETSRGQIICVGIAWNATEAMCIPFIGENGAYWSSADRNSVIAALQYNLARPDLHIIGQNFNYDASYFHECFGYTPRVAFDTLIAQSVLFPGLPRGLGFLSSMYCDWHCYWKDDARDWNNLSDYEGLFTYNCRDVCATWEIAQVLRARLVAAKLLPQFEERMKYNSFVFDMMMRGVLRSESETLRLEGEIEEALQERKLVICDAAGGPINPTSPVQVSKLLYDTWGCRKPARRGKLAGGTGDEELRQVAIWHPEREAVCTAILEHRSLASMRSNFLRAKLDPDDRLRSGFMATGTETFRITSSKNNFGRGTNLLNLSGSGTTHSGNKVPNFRKAIVPPSGYTIFDCDLKGADLQVVVWEANDADLKAKLREGLDIHYENAKELFGVREPTDVQREEGKKFIHLTNYGGSARTAAIKTGTTVHAADMAQRRWFAAHPGIKEWHNRTLNSLTNGRTITNAYGYRMVFFDRVEGLLPQALAWGPQSTIAILASLIHMAIEEAAQDVQVLLQMYDSVMGMYPAVQEEETLKLIDKASQIAIPYEDDPLFIKLSLKTSTVSWGDCGKRGWPK